MTTPSKAAMEAAEKITSELAAYIDKSGPCLVAPTVVELAAIIAHYAPGWQPIETAPMKGHCLIAFERPNGTRDVEKTCRAPNKQSWWGIAKTDRILGWMPLPEPPHRHRL